MRIAETRPRREEMLPAVNAPVRPPRVKMDVTSPIWKDDIGMHCGSGIDDDDDEPVEETERRLQVMTS